MAAPASPLAFSPKPRANPPATIQITLQSTDCRSFPVITPVMANTPIGISATVFASTPVILSNSHMSTVTPKVMDTTFIRQPWCTVPFISSSIVFLENGNSFLRSSHPTNSSISESGSIKAIHCPNPIPRFSPAGLLRA